MSPLPTSTAPDRLERALGGLALVLLACIVAAVLRGVAQWHLVPPVVWLHLVTVCIALALTPVLLWRRRGTASHRALGYVWATAMFATAVDSLFVQFSHPGHFSLIHVLSVLTIVLVPTLVWSARSHRVARHRRQVRGMIIGALLVAGFFTFPFHRLLGSWLLG